MNIYELYEQIYNCDILHCAYEVNFRMLIVSCQSFPMADILLNFHLKIQNRFRISHTILLDSISTSSRSLPTEYLRSALKARPSASIGSPQISRLSYLSCLSCLCWLS